ncbi:MAG: N-acetylmuramoyl-L-alanine amidase [Spirochaetales bacterium]|nr:N-acetylmuramoyl-L-alanine amidase [Spirochaetales bacterium]
MRRLILLLFFTILLFPLTAQVSLLSIAEEGRGRIRWEPFREIGLIAGPGARLTFSLGVPFLLKDYSEVVAIDPIKRIEGDLMVTDETAEIIIALLLPAYMRDPSWQWISTIIIDPGHGGRDAGAVGRRVVDDETVRLLEKDIVLSIGLEVADRLKEVYPEKQIILTRDSDVYLKLEDRTELANDYLEKLAGNEAIVFVSIHANASLNTRATGFEVWYLPPEERRNLINPDSVGEGNEDIIPILNTMKEEEFTVESIILARSILSGLDDGVGTLSPNRGLKKQSWAVVRNAKMPAVLIELGFITNGKEAALLSDPLYLKKLSQGIYNGVQSFVDHFDNTSGFTE